MGGLPHQQITIMNARTKHGIALYTQEEGGFLVADQMLVQVNTVFNVIISRRWKPGGNLVAEQGETQGLGQVGGVQQLEPGTRK